MRSRNGSNGKHVRTKDGHGYPRPQLVRGNWSSLNGVWEFAIDREGKITEPGEVKFDRRITVPFAPETPASGVNDTHFYNAVWYRKEMAKVKWTPCVERWELELEIGQGGQIREGLRLRVRLNHKGRTIVDDVYSLERHNTVRRIVLSDPGIDDYRGDMLWSPSHPNLLRAELEMVDEKDEVIDRVESYAAMRSVATQGTRFILNTRPYYLRMVLDQGYWPESGLTAPDDEALKRDVELARAMGFNGVRKHQKIEDPRFLYWADVIGLLVWEEMPSPYAFGTETVRRLTESWVEAIERDFSHPCIIDWGPFLDLWRRPDLPE